MIDWMSERNQFLSLKPIPHPRHYYPLHAVITTEDRQPHLLPAFEIVLVTAVTKNKSFFFHMVRYDTKINNFL